MTEFFGFFFWILTFSSLGQPVTETESYQDTPSEVHEKGQDLSLNADLASPLLRCEFELVANYDWHASDGEADCNYDENG